jgi:hypothetical protein
MMKLKLLVLFAMTILVVSVSAPTGEGGGDSEVIPPNAIGFLGGSWHPAPECVQCHVSLLSDDVLRAKLGSCECHREAYTSDGDIDMGKIRTNAHDTKACIDCHIGTGLKSFMAIPGDEIHNVHVNVDCQGCHDERELINIPETGRCETCHSANPHTVHGNKTDDLCVVCHGSYGIKYKAEGYQMEEGVPVEIVQEETIYPTISNTLKAFIEFIFK